jgi:SAM-dependent methyltransferase
MQPYKLPLVPYCCPEKRLPLDLCGNFLQSGGNERTYPIVDGIPEFLAFEAVENEETAKQLARLNTIAEADDWQAALREVYGKESGFLDYVMNPDRAKFVDLLPLSPTSDVLEIGPGLGQFTSLLAKKARSVSAIEVVAGQARFASTRCRQMGVNNVQFAVGGDDCRLPYDDAVFDVVVLNLVFEWCGSRCAGESFEAVQKRLLSEMFRVLRPGGVLYLATKNRFAVRYLIGKGDEHCYGMAFGNALPRRLTAFLLRLAGHERIGGLLYSYSEMRTLLAATGFTRMDSYWAAPEMRCPVQYIPCDAPAIRKARRKQGLVQGDTRATRFIMPCIPAPFVKFFTPGLAFFATKET